MPDSQEGKTKEKETGSEKGQLQPPAISLPKGGGAIKGIDEKFTVNPATGTGSLNVPIFTSPGRSNFQPQLSLSYNSGTGNGPFGMGWDLSVPSIARKTDKGIPRYWDQEDSDAFILSGAEDLVPLLEKKAGTWERKIDEDRVLDGKHYDILFFRPRIEGLFARIERWTNRTDEKDVFWRAITRDNITSIYGQSGTAKIYDPSDESRIFKWFLERTYDDKGNIISYEYRSEDERRVVEDSGIHHESWIHEKNRLANASDESQRYLKHVRYGNKTPYYFDNALPQNDDYLFEVVFDYGDHTYAEVEVDVGGQMVKRIQCSHTDDIDWPCRPDPFSSYRSGFEIRTYRLCRRVLMFHHFQELGSTPCLVRSTDFSYTENPVATKLIAATQTGYKRDADDAPYLFKSFPPIEFGYTEPHIDQQVRDVPEESLENLPVGLDNNQYKWIDLDGEGISGILTAQGGGLFYKPNLGNGEFGPTRIVTSQPSLANLSDGNNQFLDLAGDGQLDLVILEDPITGFYERTDDFEWTTFKPFQSKPNINWQDPNLRFIDLNGDGHADILITEDQVFVWYPSLEEAGYGEANAVHKVLDEEKGPAVVFADASESIYLADMSGDGLTDIVRIRNCDVCYWPNLGYGRFGAKVTMASPPFFDMPDQFNPKHIRLGDLDGTGTSDIFYLGSHVICFWYNRSGNSWSGPEELASIPQIGNFSSISVVDLLGHGTSCLAWSSPLPGDTSRPMRYIDLMGSLKPHLLVNIKNNLGAETKMTYAPSTKFYLKDKKAGKPWITRLSFPVHVVEKVETYDHISRNRFVTRYAYHHGYYDGIEREFRGFGRVDQRDTEEFAVLEADGMLENADNLDKVSHVPPVLKKTWFHTGVYVKGAHISKQLESEYYREGDPSLEQAGLSNEQLQAMLLDDTVLPDTIFLADGSRESYQLTAEETREACRSLKGSILRQEIYALDGTEEEDRPYSVSERNYTIELLQPEAENRYAVFFTHPRETIDFHYERILVPDGDRLLADPRVGHQMTLAVDKFGNVKRSVAIGYRRRDLPGVEEPEQQQTHITLTANRFANAPDHDNWYRVGLPAETRTFEIVKPPEPGTLGALVVPFSFDKMHNLTESLFTSDAENPADAKIWPYEKWDWHTNPANAPAETRLRLIEHVRTYYRRDDFDDEQGPLALAEVESLALPYESYKLAFTPGLLTEVYGARATDSMLADEGRYVHSGGDANWWIPSGWVFFSPDPGHSPAQELDYARKNFFLPYRYRDPLHTETVSTESFITYDDYKLLVQESRDALGNRVTTGERDPDPTRSLVKKGLDYRVLQPRFLMDPNRNCTEVVFDALGLVAGTAVMGKPEDNPAKGDRLGAIFKADLTDAEISTFLDTNDPHVPAVNLLKDATTRIVYDLHRFRKTRLAHPQDPDKWKPTFAATLARETHVSDPLPPGGLKIQIAFSYSDGFGRVIQKKIQAEKGKVPKRDGDDRIIVGADRQPEMTQTDVEPRWVGSGWTVFNNKGKPVRQFEPFFTDRHTFEFDIRIGVSPILFYDPVERVVATLHPNHTYEKVVFDPWQQTTYDVNDTITFDSQTDDDIKGFLLNPDDTPRIPLCEYQPSWHQLRTDSTHAAEFATLYPNATDRQYQTVAANKSAAHADTPTIAHSDSLGRTFLTIAHNKFKRSDTPPGAPPTEEFYSTRIILDIEGNQREVIDAKGRIVMRYDYYMAGPEENDEGGTPNRIHQSSMEAGERWILNDVAGNPTRSWDSRGHSFTTEYDALRRPVEQLATGEDSDLPDQRLRDKTIVFEKIEYGESLLESEAIARNLRTRVFKQYDGAGVITNMARNPNTNQDEAYDFKGNLIRSSLQLCTLYDESTGQLAADKIPDWSQNPALEQEIFTGSTRYDALNRPIELIAPYSDAAGSKINTIRPTYNEANLLNAVEANLREESDVNTGQKVWTPFVTNINYDAKGQRVLIEYGNGAKTSYKYDPLTFRLSHLTTVKGTGLACEDELTDAERVQRKCPKPGPVCRDLQNLWYTYDPAGNITHMRDDAQQTVFFDNQCVEPRNDYIYDAIYRLIQAQGREHIGQVGSPQTNYNDAGRVNQTHPHDGQAMRNYTERYEYDAVGNFERFWHGVGNGEGTWQRTYSYDELSLIPEDREADLKSNRLSKTTISGPGLPTTNEPYAHDSHGNINTMPHLSGMQWDYRDQLLSTTRQVVNDTPPPDGKVPETTWYVYDSSGQRVRKVTVRQNGNRKDERIYLGGFEVYRKFNGNGQTKTMERESLHIMDDEQRAALVETKTLDSTGIIDEINNDAVNQPVIRYQFSNHLGSACLELNGDAKVISYEEFYPYGSTAYQAKNRTIKSAAKRYRYSGKERDEENGFYYYGARYYTPWLGRWISPDPAGMVDGLNLFKCVRNNPIKFRDDRGFAGEEPDVSTGQVTLSTEDPVLSNARESLEFGIDVDEINPVSRGGSPTDPMNKQWLDEFTNRQTKGARIEKTSASRPERHVSLRKEAIKGRETFAKAANEMLTSKFGEVEELKKITEYAAKEAKGDTPRQKANNTNKIIREVIKGKRPNIPKSLKKKAALVRAALRTTGIDPNTLRLPGTVRPPKGSLKGYAKKGGQALRGGIKAAGPMALEFIVDYKARSAAQVLKSSEIPIAEEIELLENWGYTYKGLDENESPIFDYEPSVIQAIGNKLYIHYKLITDPVFSDALYNYSSNPYES